METVNAQWQSITSQWLINRPDSDAWQSLAEWADDLPDLTPVRMILSPVNYATHWVSLPGIPGRQIARALPFALEESLIDEVSSYLIVPGGQSSKKVRAYVLNADLIDRLLEECALHNLLLKELIPQTQLIDSGCLIQRSLQRNIPGWIISLPGRFEGWVPDVSMNAVLDSIFSSEEQAEVLLILAPQLDQANLLKTTLETGYPGRFERIECRPDSGRQSAEQRLSARPLSLLTGQYQVRETEHDKPAAWWRPLAAMTAACLIVATLWLFIDQHTAQQKADQVYSETLDLYKKLFPGERVRMLERQIHEKIDGGGEQTGGGFLQGTNLLAKVYAAQGLQKQIQLTSLRYNDRLQEIVIEVRAGNLNELQTLRQALEKEGLVAEVASATNDKDGVKGRIKIGGSA